MSERFTWGRVIAEHSIGEYSFIEYHPWKRRGVSVLTGEPDLGEIAFHAYIDGKDTCHGFHSLDAALAGAIAYKLEGANSRAGTYFMRMIQESGK